MLPILLALVFIIILLAVVIAGQPGQFSVSRWTKIDAPPGQVFPHVNELRNWEAWNPWGKLDPNCKMTYDGPPAGAGASYSWSGNNKVGSGRCTVTESVPDEHVHLRLEFFKPMVATNLSVFTFEPNGDQTFVTWTMSGKNSFGGKVFGLLMNCEKMCGSQFDKGLAQMKSVVEAPGKTAARA
jgi:Polyketide cyclase / dehydrase and lipid transport